MSTPYVPAKPTIVSVRTDIYPDIQWITVGDPDLPTGSSDGITYDLELWHWDAAASKWRYYGADSSISGASAVDVPITHSWMSGLKAGKYQVKVRADDGGEDSGWSDPTTFRIVQETIDISKVYVTAVIDAVTGSEMRFFNSSTYFLYKKCSFLAQLQQSLLSYATS